MTSSRVSSLRLDALLSHAREPAFVLGADRRIVGVNRAFEELVGYPVESLVGLPCAPQGSSQTGELAELGASFYPPPESLSGRPSGRTSLILNSRGERQLRRVEYWPFHDVHGTLTGLFGLVRALEDPRHAPDSDSLSLRSELLELRASLERTHGFDSLVGEGPAHKRLLDQVRAAAGSSMAVLIVGEPGSGKRSVARTIHSLGVRNHAPLVLYDLTALPPEVLARELFVANDQGEDASDSPAEASERLNLPDGATLLLTDIFNLPRDLQAQLASALDSRTRLIATTTEDPEQTLKADRLRPDLYYALTSMVIRLFPLRERLDELPLLAQHALEPVSYTHLRAHVSKSQVLGSRPKRSRHSRPTTGPAIFASWPAWWKQR